MKFQKCHPTNFCILFRYPLQGSDGIFTTKTLKPNGLRYIKFIYTFLYSIETKIHMQREGSQTNKDGN